MRPIALGSSLFVAFSLAGCAGGDQGNAAGTTPTGPTLSGSPDAGSFAFSDDAAVEAGPLLMACDPNSAGSCTSQDPALADAGFFCYAQPTSPSWWVNLQGTCTFDCNSQTYALCDSLGGVCGCPVPQGATTGNCSPDGGTPMVCVPGLKPGTSPGGNEGEGGCGTPGCGGGVTFEGGSGPADATLE